MVFVRPEHVLIPTVWSRFSKTKSGITYQFRVQDLMEDRYEEAVGLLVKHFIDDEPPCRYINARAHPKAVEELTTLWTKTVEEKLSVVCILEDATAEKEKIVGVNVLCVCSKSDPEEEFQTDDRVWYKLYGAVELVSRGADVFLQYDVDKYLTAYGLVVVPQYRGMHLGMHILQARIPLCRAIGINLTATVFTAAASQALAKMAGFQTLYEISYDELAKRGFKFPGIMANSKVSKLMTMYISSPPV